MSTTKSQALVLGASGLVGLHTTKMLLQQNTYDVIYAVSRRGIPLEHERLVQIQADFNSIDSFIEKLHINHIFSCLGSTKKKTPDKSDYLKVDHDYPVKVAKIGQSNGATKFSFVSALGANVKSNNFYMQMKGQVEEDIKALNFEELYIMRPALITGNRDEVRPAEGFASWFFKIINPLLLGNLKKYRSIDGKTIAQALVKTAGIDHPGVHTYNTEQIKKLA
ncbi:NAD-dependent epimerase/dehydratase family protein [Sphingobacterium corticibacter]|uniref:Nucleoside-diphosphate sugar epimerase n=1 Tax=Sphingobacterium corticibacter TaxID=2171749 RepID=A0A2T8HK40_9SPHI|nr:NAD-dependent epimerase/dehydratase family protein [Sphingobacterium corticibacter]PVH25818.1 nucleoside-diphosphate sugar epimerase [Sphingobacterium corticibacter]